VRLFDPSASSGISSRSELRTRHARRYIPHLAALGQPPITRSGLLALGHGVTGIAFEYFRDVIDLRTFESGLLGRPGAFGLDEIGVRWTFVPRGTRTPEAALDQARHLGVTTPRVNGHVTAGRMGEAAQSMADSWSPEVGSAPTSRTPFKEPSIRTDTLASRAVDGQRSRRQAPSER
jgi:hypothetical protein